ncbi:MerR family transcriptional regulator [Desulfosarcina sp. BuS5]|uniref:MerR family transcriptional regulator n=1 Tax=Desulfosarcina sp. BuS5 TaxID=933262 RepID=UPI000487F51B|nr:MerR family transcriptional regulator [Desulfosarcina sp. BuS5]
MRGYAFIDFKRTDGGQRHYIVENIAVIEEIKELKIKGMSLSEIKGSHKDVKTRLPLPGIL